MALNLKSSGGGSVTVDVPSTASNYTATLPAGTGNVVVNGINGALVSGTSVTASGTSVDFTDIPSWVKRITVMFNGVSTNGTSILMLRVGDSGGVISTGYVGNLTALTNAAAVNIADAVSGLAISSTSSAANTASGQAILSRLDGNTWVGTSCVRTATTVTTLGATSVTLSNTLDRIRITTINGTDTFDAGSINILYE